MASNEKDSPISLLKTLSEIDGNLEYFAVAKDGTTYKCTPAQLKDFVLKGETPVVRIPLAVLNLSNSSSSEDILNAFGGKETFIALCEKIYGRDVVCVCQGFASDDENMKTGYVTQAISCKHIDAENAILMFLINIDNVSHRLMINCVDGTASFSKTTVGDASVIVLPREILDLTGSSSSEEIFATFGGIDKYKDLLEKLSANNYLVQIGEPSLDSLRHIYTLVEYSVKFASNKQSGALSLNIYNENRQLRRLHLYLENNGTTARCGESSTFQLVRDSDVLTKTNTSPFTPTGDYQPATKEYVDNIGYGKVIDVADGSLLVINKNICNTEAYDHVVKIFGSTDVIKNMIIDICNNHTKYYIHSYSSYRNCIELSSVYTYYTDEERYEIEFNISYYTFQGPVSKRIAIALNLFDNDKSEDRLFIEDILVSDNLTTLTKKTAAEYEAIGSKDDNTAYCVTV